MESRPPVECIYKAEHDERKNEEAGRKGMRLGITKRLDMVVDGDGQDPRLPGNIPADHQDNYHHSCHDHHINNYQVRPLVLGGFS